MTGATHVAQAQGSNPARAIPCSNTGVAWRAQVSTATTCIPKVPVLPGKMSLSPLADHCPYGHDRLIWWFDKNDTPEKRSQSDGERYSSCISIGGVEELLSVLQHEMHRYQANACEG